MTFINAHLESIIVFITSGGLGWIFFFKTKRRSMENDVATKEFASLQSMVDQFSTQMEKMVTDYGALSAQYVTLQNKVNDLTQRNNELRSYISTLLREGNFPTTEAIAKIKASIGN